LVEAESQRLLIDAGIKLIEDVKLNPKAIDWIDQLVIDRVDRKGLSDSLINAIFKIDDTQLPSFSGLYDSNGEYVIVKLNKVVTENIEDNDSIDTYYNDYIALIESEVEAAYISNLRVNADIEFNESVFANQ
jgi:peptidyl-prolyl cis-trans isomerase D